LAPSSRKSDGSLPDIDFMHLASGSELIDTGVDLGLSYWGDAPDLGAFESNFTTLVDERMTLVEFSLDQNFPNPFNPTTTIRYSVPIASKVILKIYNLKGQVIDRLVDQNQEPGVHSVCWDARNISSGVYYYQIQIGSFQQVKKMILLK